MTIVIQKSPPNLPAINQGLLKLAIASTLSKHDRQHDDVTLHLTNDTEMRKLNQAYRDEPGPTDVLSFNEDFIDPETGSFYLGDIIISLDQAEKQAISQGHSLDEECTFLAIHGTLHLLGFDHDEPEEKAKMWALQDEIFHEVLLKFREDSK